eukprot:360958-Chlamydomonas_euryale.AAC.2
MSSRIDTLRRPSPFFTFTAPSRTAATQCRGPCAAPRAQCRGAAGAGASPGGCRARWRKSG